MISPIMYPNFNSFSMVSWMIQPTCQKACPVLSYITFGKLPENPVVTPSSSVQLIAPSNINRFLQTVTVEAVTTPTP